MQPLLKTETEPNGGGQQKITQDKSVGSVCEVCGKKLDIPGHTLCKEHWLEKQKEVK